MSQRASTISSEVLVTPTMSGITSIAGMRTKYFGSKPDDFVFDTLDNIIVRLQLDNPVALTDEERNQRLEAIDAIDLLTALETLNKEVANTRTENYILTDFLEKNDPKLLIGLKERRETILKSTKTGGLTYSRISDSRSIARSRSIATTHSGFTDRRKMDYRLNYRSKSEMAEKLAVEIEKRIRDLEAREMQNVKMLNAKIEELALLYEETVDTTKNFRLHFLQDARDIRFLQIAPEKQMEQKLRKFVQNWLRNAQALISTMRLKSTTLQEYCKQLRAEYISKSDLSGVLSAVDFEQLIIKRDQLLAALEEKSTDMAGLKGVTGKASMAMAREKQMMMTIERQIRIVTQKTADVIKAIGKLEEEINIVKEGNIKDTITLEAVKRQLLEYEAPSINRYIEKKVELINLEKEEKMIQRKINIQSLKLSTMLKRCKKVDFNKF